MGVLKTASLQETVYMIESNNGNRRAPTAVSNEWRREQTEESNEQTGEQVPRPKTHFSNRGFGRHTLENKSSWRSSADTSELRKIEQRSLDRTAKIVLKGKLKKKGGISRRSVDLENRGSELGTPREVLKDQDIVVGTLFTDVELNRIIVNVGGGYLLKGESNRKTKKTRMVSQDNVDQYCYLGLGQLISKTKKRRENLHIQHLLT